MSENIATQQSQSSLIPVPPDFPVNWEDPVDAHLCWTQDRLHFPDPVTPLDFSIIEQVMDAGLNEAARTYDIPISLCDRYINTYVYTAVVPSEFPHDDADFIVSPGEDSRFIGAQRSEDRLQDAMKNLSNLWEGEWLPELQQHLAYWEAYHLRSSSMPALLDHLHETEGRLQRVWEIHFLLFFPMVLAIGEFIDAYQDLFSDAGPFAPYELLGGFESKTKESDQLLWKLSRRTLASPTVRQVFTDNPAPDVIAKLSESTEGQAFLAELYGYLELHGQQQGDKVSLNNPFWIEDPTPAIKNLQDYIAQPNRDLLTEMKKAVARREQGVAKARKQLQTYPRPVVEQFEFLLKVAQVGYTLKEEHIYWLDSKVSYQTRRLLLEIGRRLADAGAIGMREDVFYLSLDELKETATTLPNAKSRILHLDRRSVINARKAVERQFTTCTPPSVLGTLPSEPPPDDAVTRMFFQIEGDVPPASETPGELRGNAGSPGVVQGTAKVVRVLADATKLDPGDILVAVVTAPAWTPLFGSVAAVVTDGGGILSHCAVVAREFGIPAVVGTGTATAAIQDGQMIEVDGNVGIIRILSSGN